jgi:hypothetical protein
LININAGFAIRRYGACVPIYYFQVINDDVTDDFEGAELADDRAARAYAIVAARALAADTVSKGHFTTSHRIVIQNEHREPVCEVRFDEAVELRP